MKVLSRYLTVLTFLFAATSALSAQNPDRRIEAAGELHRAYDFEGALAIYRNLLDGADSTLAATIHPLVPESENGLNMLRFAMTPKVVAVTKVSASDFYLWYSHLNDRGWVPFPNEFNDSGCGIYNAMYFNRNASRTVFSAPDGNGGWSLMSSEKVSGNLWSAPQPICGAVSSQKNEIFPIMSEDGQRLYFSSNGLAGMGGYDIYVCHLSADGRTWSAPQNLGFPYSSPYDDFLYCDTPDGKFSIFASNRDCERGYMKIYVLAFENEPVRKALTSLDEIRRIAALEPQKGGKAATVEEKPTKEVDGRFGDYFKAVRSLAAIKDSLEHYSSDAEYLALQARMAEVQAAISGMEMQMLYEGIVPPTVEIEPAESKVAEAAPVLTYTFRKNAPGTSCGISIEAPEKPDYSFRIEKKSKIIEGNDLPEGICYQIQLCAVSSRLAESRLKGITPVFEVKQKSGKYIYYAGMFDTFAQANAVLPKIKSLGFSPFTVAWKDGKSCQIKTARSLEKKK